MGACLAHKERLHFSHRADSYRLLHSHHDSPDALSACLPGHMGLYLSEPVREVHHTRLGGGEVEVGGAHVQGWRLDQEDSVALCHLDTKHTMAAVFDGHGGREVRASGCAPVALTRHALWDIRASSQPSHRPMLCAPRPPWRATGCSVLRSSHGGGGAQCARLRGRRFQVGAEDSFCRCRRGALLPRRP